MGSKLKTILVDHDAMACPTVASWAGSGAYITGEGRRPARQRVAVNEVGFFFEKKKAVVISHSGRAVFHNNQSRVAAENGKINQPADAFQAVFHVVGPEPSWHNLIVDRPNDIMRVGNTDLFEIARDFNTVSTRWKLNIWSYNPKMQHCWGILLWIVTQVLKVRDNAVIQIWARPIYNMFEDREAECAHAERVNHVEEEVSAKRKGSRDDDQGEQQA
ncbi:hypothetical protein F5J12DRAFT_929108 [Pisolithus orientalis]|uniref:uncharacterized protein n=1 Tax=Pisolithus orientalis TaxID=936130 RepID=UPI00222445C4|nr:uncharacterized protein F5J12DRAFT_929108 [Pisolithus orientalis]KAI5996907.1 hypothetical protein F5J12DRAFT_929108 [Pisolithus orientalis]